MCKVHISRTDFWARDIYFLLRADAILIKANVLRTDSGTFGSVYPAWVK